MVVTRVSRADARAQHPCQRDQTAPHRTGDGVTVVRADDMDNGIRRAGGLSLRNGEAADCQDDQELEPTANRKKICAGLPASRAVLSAPRIILNSDLDQGCR